MNRQQVKTLSINDSLTSNVRDICQCGNEINDGPYLSCSHCHNFAQSMMRDLYYEAQWERDDFYGRSYDDYLENDKEYIY